MSVFPQFAERTPHGVFQQQDADEAFQTVLSAIDPCISTDKSLVDDLFHFDVEFTINNTENEEEPSTTAIEAMRKLPCVIDNQANPINLLKEGIEAVSKIFKIFEKKRKETEIVLGSHRGSREVL